MTRIHLGLDLGVALAGLLQCPRCILSINTCFIHFAQSSLCSRSAFAGINMGSNNPEDFFQMPHIFSHFELCQV